MLRNAAVGTVKHMPECRLDLLVPGDVLNDGWIVVDTFGVDSQTCDVVVRSPTGEEKMYRAPRGNTIEVNKHTRRSAERWT